MIVGLPNIRYMCLRCHRESSAERECSFCRSKALIALPGSRKPAKRKSPDEPMSASEIAKLPPRGKIIRGHEFLGSIPPKWSMLLWGPPGGGKSTYALMLADALAKKTSPTVYATSEEGRESETMRNKLILMGIDDNDYLLIEEGWDFATILNVYRRRKAKNLIIDSINDADMTPKHVKALQRIVAGAFIYVMHATKTGSYKGDSSFGHKCDIVAEVSQDGTIRMKKNRLGPKKSYRIFDEKHIAQSNAV